MLLTRSPLYSPPERGFLVRLACVRRAASVDSEPGSNSRRKVFHHPRPDPKAPPERRSHRGCRSDIHPESDDFVLHVQPICQRSGPPRIIPRSAYRRPAVPATDEPRAQAMPARNSGSEAQKAPPNRRSSVTLPSRHPQCKGKNWDAAILRMAGLARVEWNWRAFVRALGGSCGRARAARNAGRSGRAALHWQ